MTHVLTPRARLERFVDCDARDFDLAFQVVQAHIRVRWGIKTSIADIPDPFTGDLDGEQIFVDNDLGPEDALFILVHLTGHTAQWNTSRAERHVGLLDIRRRPGDKLLQTLKDYEHKAARYGLQLLHDVGIFHLDQWLADIAACDWRYLEHFYCTGVKKPFFDFWQTDTPCIAPLAIPDFTPRKWATRLGTVI